MNEIQSKHFAKKYKDSCQSQHKHVCTKSRFNNYCNIKNLKSSLENCTLEIPVLSLPNFSWYNSRLCFLSSSSFSFRLTNSVYKQMQTAFCFNISCKVCTFQLLFCRCPKCSGKSALENWYECILECSGGPLWLSWQIQLCHEKWLLKKVTSESSVRWVADEITAGSGTWQVLTLLSVSSLFCSSLPSLARLVRVGAISRLDTFFRI